MTLQPEIYVPKNYCINLQLSKKKYFEIVYRISYSSMPMILRAELFPTNKPYEYYSTYLKNIEFEALPAENSPFCFRLSWAVMDYLSYCSNKGSYDKYRAFCCCLKKNNKKILVC